MKVKSPSLSSSFREDIQIQKQQSWPLCLRWSLLGPAFGERDLDDSRWHHLTSAHWPRVESREFGIGWLNFYSMLGVIVGTFIAPHRVSICYYVKITPTMRFHSLQTCICVSIPAHPSIYCKCILQCHLKQASRLKKAHQSKLCHWL